MATEVDNHEKILELFESVELKQWPYGDTGNQDEEIPTENALKDTEQPTQKKTRKKKRNEYDDKARDYKEQDDLDDPQIED